jgi:hypothetical protein
MGTVYQQYYTKSSEIVGYMINNLSLMPNSNVLEPCAGDGVFINALLQVEKKINIDAFELDEKEAKRLKTIFNSENISIKNADTLLYNDFINGNCNNRYDFIIANPPYGAWQDYEKREKLKIIYPGLYVKETYTTFLFLCLNLLKPGGRLVFITPNTYLNLHMHTYLRKFILQNALVKEIAIFPSSFFPGVNFGYSKLSIITLEKTNTNHVIYNNTIKILDNFKKPIELITKENIRTVMVKQGDILKNADCAFVFSDNKHFSRLIKQSFMHIGDIADCVTGIYTGDDKRFIKVVDKNLKNGKNYQQISNNEIYQNISDIDLNGLNCINSYIPIIKGGNTRYIKQNLWYINWSKEAVAFYKVDKKSRFQNSQYYFKQGLAVPMVSSNSVTASLLNYRIFDQSIVGIFPKKNEYVYYLLAFFNSSICTKLLRMINPSANNSANYIKKIPIVIPDNNTLVHINNLVELLLSEKGNDSDTLFVENELDNIFNVIFYKEHKNSIKKNVQK